MPRPRTTTSDAEYEAKKAYAAKRSRDASAAGRDIGEIPAVVNPERRARCERDLKAFCEEYFPDWFPLDWSPDHLKAIASAEKSVLEGGLFALAMPRGSGKTTIARAAALWAILYGHRTYLFIITADGRSAKKFTAGVKRTLETNADLLKDFPEACFPIKALDGMSLRAKGQTYQGERTQIEWTTDRLVLPTIKGSPSSSAIIEFQGITGAVRGAQHVRPDGAISRPDLVIIDDPQTKESARSVGQCEERHEIIMSDALGLAGPDVKISGMMPCTVIYPNDLAERILDREESPDWNGQKTSMVVSFPTNERLWEEYGNVRAASLRQHGDQREATAFYAKNREAMDAGAEVSWPARKNTDELSAIQHAMNLKLRDETAFFSEYQNAPLSRDEDNVSRIDPDLTMSRTNGLARRELPDWAHTVVAHVDVHKALLWYSVGAFADDGTGCCLDWSCWPEQNVDYVVMNRAKRTIQHEFPQMSLEGQLFAALQALFDRLFPTTYTSPDGHEMQIERLLVDAQWGSQTDTVYEAIRTSQHASKIYPAHGKAVGPAGKPMIDWPRKKGVKKGHHWQIAPTQGRKIRHVLFDPNIWKSYFRTRVTTDPGAPGGFTWWGTSPDRHRCMADHVAAESSKTVSTAGREVDLWTADPGRDNHLLDNHVGLQIAANIEGVKIRDASGFGKQRRPGSGGRRTVSMADRQRAALEEQGHRSSGRKTVSMAERQRAAMNRR